MFSRLAISSTEIRLLTESSSIVLFFSDSAMALLDDILVRLSAIPLWGLDL